MSFWDRFRKPAPVPETGKLFLKPDEKAPASIPSGVEVITPTQRAGESVVSAGVRYGGGSSRVQTPTATPQLTPEEVRLKDIEKIQTQRTPTQAELRLQTLGGQKEVYDSRIRMYVKPDVRGTTQVTRPPTFEELRAIEEAEYRGDLYGRAITGVPALMVGGIISTPTTDKEIEQLGEINFSPFGLVEDSNIVTAGKKYFNIFKGGFDYERDLKEAIKISDNLGDLNIGFENKTENILSQLDVLEKNIKNNEWTGSQKDLDSYNRLVGDYNKELQVYEAKFESYASTPEYQRVIESPERKDVYQRIADTDLSEIKKGALMGSLALFEGASFLVPPVRVIKGADILSSGAYDIHTAETDKQKLLGAGKIGLGGLVAFSGLKGGSSTSSLFGKVATGKGVLATTTRAGLQWGLPAGVSTLYGVSIGKRTGSVGGGIGAGVGLFVGLKSPEIVGGAFKLGKGFAKQQKDIFLDKKAQIQTYDTSQQVNVIDERGQIIRMSSAEAKARGLTILKMSPTEARGEFSRASETRQLNILKDAFKDRVYLDKAHLDKDVQKAINFMKQAGLSNIQIEERINVLFPNYFKTITIQSSGFQPDIKQDVRTIQFLKTDIKPDVRTITQTKTDTKNIFDTKQDTQGILLSDSFQPPKTRQKEALAFSFAQPQTFKQETKQDTIQKQSFLQLFKQSPRTKQIERLDLVSKNVFEKMFKQPKDIKLKEPTPIKPSGFISGKKKKEKVKKEYDEDLFKAFVRTKGEDVEIGAFSTKAEAKEELFGKIRKTLRASGFIERGGQRIKIDTGFTEFKPSKVDSLRIVEPRSRRLSTRSEVFEIKQAKKGKKKKRTSWFD